MKDSQFAVKVFSMVAIAYMVLLFATTLTSSKVIPKVKCTPDQMLIEVPLTAITKRVYLKNLRHYPKPACRPHTDPTGALAVFQLDLRDVYQCAVTRVVNMQTGNQIYYQTVVIENEEVERNKSPKISHETIYVKCSSSVVLGKNNHTVSKRNVLPAGFQEPEELEITTSLTEHAPEPILGVGVRQGGKLVTGELNVSPGTPLQMEIFLDKTSAPIYGLLVSQMQVTDTNTQEETIIYNGCSIDPYLFENFNTVDGDFLAAKFRAFKFPESTYVQFKGTVNVCLDKCKGVECSDGRLGFGRRRRRRRRSLPPSGPAAAASDANGLFEVTITSFLRVDYDDNDNDNSPKSVVRNETRIYNNKKLIVGGTEKFFNSTNTRYYKTMDKGLEGPKYTAIDAADTNTNHFYYHNDNYLTSFDGTDAAVFNYQSKSVLLLLVLCGYYVGRL